MLCSLTQRLYREKGENQKHNYTLTGELPEMVQAKLNAKNLSEVKKKNLHTNAQKTPPNQLPVGRNQRELSVYICYVALAEPLQGVLDEVT